MKPGEGATAPRSKTAKASSLFPLSELDDLILGKALGHYPHLLFIFEPSMLDIWGSRFLEAFSWRFNYSSVKLQRY